MTQPIYTAIPDTSDTGYWIRTVNEHDRSVIFKPKYKELYCELKEKAHNTSQCVQSCKDRNEKNWAVFGRSWPRHRNIFLFLVIY